MFKLSYAGLDSDRTFGSGSILPVNRKHPAGQLAATVMVNLLFAILVKFPCGCHCATPDPYRLKTEAARALGNKFLVFRHIYKLTRRG